MRSTPKTDEVMTAPLIACGIVLPSEYMLFYVGQPGISWLTTRFL